MHACAHTHTHTHTNACHLQALDVCTSCLDLLLRWAVLRLAEGNTQTLVAVTGLLRVLLEGLDARGYRLSDAEAKHFLPGLVEKCGQPTPQMKAECRDLIRRVGVMHPPAKVVIFVQEGLNSKNNRYAAATGALLS